MKIFDITNRIRMIKPIHKLVMLIFLGSLVYNVTTSINGYNESQKAITSYSIEDCQSKNVGLPDLAISCIEKIKSNKKEWSKEYRNQTIIGLSIIHAFIFPFYLIFFNIITFIHRGYKAKYKFSDMSILKKFVHVFGLIFVSLGIFISYLSYDYISYRLKVPVTLFDSQVLFNYDQATIRGVWVKDVYQDQDITLKNVAQHFGRNDEQYTLDSHLIQCSSGTMTCTHNEISVSSVGSSKFLQPFEQSESRITEWNENSIKSEADHECFTDEYTFNDAEDTGVWLRLSKNKPECSNRDITSVGHKLWDGLELDSKLRANERGQLLKFIGGMFD